MENDVLEMLENLYAMVSEAWGVPLGNDKCIIERERVLNILDDVKTNLPVELAEAKRLVSAKEEFISSAKREAESIRKLAEERARHMVEEQEIMREANSQSKQILAEAEAKSREMVENAQSRSAELRRVAWEYVDSALRETETTVNTALNSISTVRNKFASYSMPDTVAPAAPEIPVLKPEDIPEELRDADEAQN